MQEPETPTPPPSSANTTLAPLRDALARLRSAIKLQLLVSRVGLIAAAYVGAMLLGGLMDYLLRFPSGLRVVAFVLALVLLVWLLARVLLPIVRFRPSDTDLALRLEHTSVGKERGWTGVLASGLELADTSQPTWGDPRLASIASDLAGERFRAAKVQVLRLLNPSDLRRSLLFGALACAAVLGLSFFSPQLLAIGTRRVLLPWTDTTWPKRTGVLMASQPVAHPLGTALPLRAILTRSARDASQTRVSVRYRLLVEGREVASQQALLTPQGQRTSVDPGLGGRPIEGDLFERLLDVQGLLPESISSQDRATKDIKLEYWFETSDDATPAWRTALVEPPAVVSMSLAITPPAYLARLGDALGASVLQGTIDAGNGLDARSSVGPILAGSNVAWTIRLNKDVPVLEGEAQAAWLEASLPGLAALEMIQRTIGPREWLVEFRPTTNIRTSIRPKDQFDIPSREEAGLRLEVMEDRPPSAAIIDPPQDESVLPTARIPAIAEGRDDVAIWQTTLRSQVAKVPQGASPGAIAEPQAQPAGVASVSRDVEADQQAFTQPRVVRASSTLDLASLNLAPGDEVWLSATTIDAQGAFASSDPLAIAQATITSPVRRLRIISESQFVEQLRSELAGLRDAARRLEQDQRTLAEQRPAANSQAGDDQQAAQQASQQATQQGTIRDRVQPLKDSLERLERRAQRNALEDTSLTGLLSDAAQTAQAASDQAQQAAQALGELATQRDAQAREEASQQLAQAQDQAQQELENLSDMLSQGDDDWTVRRQLEQLLSDQRQLRSQTSAAGGESAGQELSELPQRQREDLERLARSQQELSQRANQALDAAQSRAQQMQEANPAQAQAIREAAQRARARQLSQRQQQASEQIRQNQTGGAQQSQRQAEEAIEEALEALDDVQQARDEQLQRVLADIMQSLEQLIAQQQTELDRLGKALAGEQLDPAQAPLDRAMIALQQNTLGVLSKARKEAPDATRLAQLIQAAGDAQAGAIVALRQQPPNLASADPQERTSLQRLKDALEEASQLNQDAQQRDQERVRRELRREYAQALEEQVVLRADAQPLLDQEPTRRTRTQARSVGDKQAALRERLEQLRSKTQDLQDAKVFDFAHTRLDKSMADAAKTLREGSFTRAADRGQSSAIATLKALVEALKENNQQDDQLQNAGGGGGGGGQSGQQQDKAIPDLAELILLRGLQAEAADLTKALGEAGDADAGELSAAGELQQALAEQAQALLERLQQDNQAPGAEPDQPDQPDQAEPPQVPPQVPPQSVPVPNTPRSQ